MNHSAPLGRWNKVWSNIYRQDAWVKQKYQCCYCGSPIKKGEVTADHVVPKKKGGTTTKDNIKACCQPCNKLKGHLSVKKFRQLLMKPPKDCHLDWHIAHTRYRIWQRTKLAQKRIQRYSGIPE